MSPVVSFHRKSRGSVRWDEGSRLFEIHLILEKTVDPLSGMTLNLVDVDRILAGLWRDFVTMKFADSREFALACAVFLDREVRALSADIVSVDCTDPLTGEKVHARINNGAPAEVFSWEMQPARIFVSGHNRHRSGFFSRRVPWRPFAAAQAVLEMEVHSEREMCEKWAAQDSKTLEVSFEDELSQETWRWGK